MKKLDVLTKLNRTVHLPTYNKVIAETALQMKAETEARAMSA